MPIEAISKLLGHASTTTTEKHYARMRDSHAFSLVENAWALKPIASIELDIRGNPCQSMPVQKKPELNFRQKEKYGPGETEGKEGIIGTLPEVSLMRTPWILSPLAAIDLKEKVDQARSEVSYRVGFVL